MCQDLPPHSPWDQSIGPDYSDVAAEAATGFWPRCAWSPTSGLVKILQKNPKERTLTSDLANLKPLSYFCSPLKPLFSCFAAVHGTTSTDSSSPVQVQHERCEAERCSHVLLQPFLHNKLNTFRSEHLVVYSSRLSSWKDPLCQSLLSVQPSRWRWHNCESARRTDASSREGRSKKTLCNAFIKGL